MFVPWAGSDPQKIIVLMGLFFFVFWMGNKGFIFDNFWKCPQILSLEVLMLFPNVLFAQIWDNFSDQLMVCLFWSGRKTSKGKQTHKWKKLSSFSHPRCRSHLYLLLAC